MTVAIINQWIGTIDVLDLTEDEKKRLAEADSDEVYFDDFYSTAWNIANAHGYNMQEPGVTLLACDNITVYYENSNNTMRL